MKKAEVKELGSKELQERLDAAVAALNQLEITHSISPLDSPAKITHATQDDCAYENRVAQTGTYKK